jgi:hypothetical protein
MDPETLNQVCINANAQIVGIVATGIAITSGIVNAVPSPDKIKNPALRFLSRVLHFAAADIVTAVKK